MDEAERARWLIAPHVSRAARVLARERGCAPEDLSLREMEALRDLALLAYGEGVLGRQPPAGAFKGADPWVEETQPQRPSRMPTRRAPR